jgi:hypothetical protein
MTGFNTHQVHADGKDFLEIHEHLRPIQTLLVNQSVQKRRALMELGVGRPVKELFEVSSLLFERNHVQPDSPHLFPQRSVCSSHGINVPAESQEEQPGNHANGARGGQESAVRFEGLRR